MHSSEAWMLGSYRRLDLLDVPAFHLAPDAVAALHAPRGVRHAMLVELATDWPQLALPLGEHLVGGAVPAAQARPLDRLLVLLRHLASPLRFEPQNVYGVHRGVPSPRCQYPLRLMLLSRAAGGPRLWRYLPEHHALEDLGLHPAWQASLGDDELAVVGVARFWALADKYGEFAPYPTMLEAGMAQAQLLHLGAALGWQGAALPESALPGAALLGAYEVGAYGWRGAAGGVAEDLERLPRRELRVADEWPSAGLEERFPRLAPLSEVFAPAGDAGRVPASEQATDAAAAAAAVSAGSADLFALMRTRHSGNDAVGMAPLLRPLPAGSRALLLARWRALTARRGRVAGEAELSAVCAWLDADAPGVYDLAGEPLPAPAGRLDELLQRSLPRADMRWSMAPFKAAFFLCVDPVHTRAAHGEAGLRRLHLAAGAAAQDLSLAAASLGLFARPMRMLREPVLERGLSLPGLPVYQVLCGLNRSTNLSWELL